MGGSLEEEEINSILKLFPLPGKTYAIETGTYHGESARLLSKHFSHVYTIEINEPLFHQAISESKEHKNITFCLGDSVVALPKILEKIKKDNIISEEKKEKEKKEIGYSILFFIDAHISGSDSSWNGRDYVPVFSELNVILDSFDKSGIFIIDDVRLFNNADDWKGITFENIRNLFKQKGKTVLIDFVRNDRYYILVK